MLESCTSPRGSTVPPVVANPKVKYFIPEATYYVAPVLNDEGVSGAIAQALAGVAALAPGGAAIPKQTQ